MVDNTEVIEQVTQKSMVKYMNLMLASTSHEFRTPVNAINHGIQCLRPALPPQSQETLRMMQSSVDLLLSLINDILDLAKLENEAFELNETRFSVPSLLAEVKEIFRFQAEGKGLRFGCAMDFEEPTTDDLTIVSDQKRLTQVLLNIISNSLKFTQDGFISVRARLLSPQLLEFSVADSGYGISEIDQKKLFKAFGLGQESKQKNIHGSGLGLNICKKIITRLGGDI